MELLGNSQNLGTPWMSMGPVALLLLLPRSSGWPGIVLSAVFLPDLRGPRHRTPPPPPPPASVFARWSKSDQSGPARYGFAAMDWRTVARRSVLQFLRQLLSGIWRARRAKLRLSAATGRHGHTHAGQGLPTITTGTGAGTGTTRSPDQQQSLSGSTSTRHARLWTGRRAAFRCRHRNQFEQYTQSLAMAQPWNPSFRYTQGSFNNPIGLRNFQQNPFQNQYQVSFD